MILKSCRSKISLLSSFSFVPIHGHDVFFPPKEMKTWWEYHGLRTNTDRCLSWLKLFLDCSNVLRPVEVIPVMAEVVGGEVSSSPCEAQITVHNFDYLKSSFNVNGRLPFSWKPFPKWVQIIVHLETFLRVMPVRCFNLSLFNDQWLLLMLLPLNGESYVCDDWLYQYASPFCYSVLHSRTR